MTIAYDSVIARRHSSSTFAYCRTLLQTLGALPQKHFSEVAAQLKFVESALPSDASSASDAARGLLTWADSPHGPGRAVLETVLSQVIEQHSITAKVILSFAITSNIHDTTAEQVNAFVHQLRHTIQDPSLKVAFFEPGGIKLILSGGMLGLESLQDLFREGKLTSAELPPIETVSLMDEGFLDEKKTRLVKALQLRDQSLQPLRKRSHVRARARANALARTHYLILARIIARDFSRGPASDLQLAHDSDLYGDVESEIVRSNTCDINSEIDIAHSLELVRALNRALACTRSRNIARLIRLARTLARIHTHTHYSAFAMGLDRAIAHAMRLLIGHVLRLSFSPVLLLTSNDNNLDLKQADLRGANLVNLNLIDADLSEANLTGADLTGADLTGAEVSGTIFGDNLGLTTSQQRHLQRKGAIFQNCAGLVWYKDDMPYGL